MTTIKNEGPIELDKTLSSLILGGKVKHNEEDCFTIDLFEAPPSKSSLGSASSTSTIDTTSLQRPKPDNSFKQAILKELEEPLNDAQEEDEEDLLAMMDKATK